MPCKANVKTLLAKVDAAAIAAERFGLRRLLDASNGTPGH
jgi:hypothetical protein